jgi:hypothetical protein
VDSHVQNKEGFVNEYLYNEEEYVFFYRINIYTIYIDNIHYNTYINAYIIYIIARAQFRTLSGNICAA